MGGTREREIRHVITGSRGMHLSGTTWTARERVHVLTPESQQLVIPGEWCLAEFVREAKRCLIYDCIPLTGRHLVHVYVSERGASTRMGHVKGQGDLTQELEQYFELTTPYRWAKLIQVHLVYEGAEHLVRDIIHRSQKK